MLPRLQGLCRPEEGQQRSLYHAAAESWTSRGPRQALKRQARGLVGSLPRRPTNIGRSAGHFAISAATSGLQPVPTASRSSREHDPRIPRSRSLRRRLSARQQPRPAHIAALVAAVKRCRPIRLKPTASSATSARALNGPGAARQLAVNLERLRWLERNPPATRIDVNTAAAFLEYWRDGTLARPPQCRGRPAGLGDPAARLTHLPARRATRSGGCRTRSLEDELADEEPGLFRRAQGMEWRDGRLVQLPGPKNSLGQVKFDMRNDQAIYLHDTPAKALFGRPERHRSHGCVRVAGRDRLRAAAGARRRHIGRVPGSYDQRRGKLREAEDRSARAADVPHRFPRRWEGALQSTTSTAGTTMSAYALGLCAQAAARPRLKQRRARTLGP